MTNILFLNIVMFKNYCYHTKNLASRRFPVSVETMMMLLLLFFFFS